MLNLKNLQKRNAIIAVNLLVTFSRVLGLRSFFLETSSYASFGQSKVKKYSRDQFLSARITTIAQTIKKTWPHKWDRSPQGEMALTRLLKLKLLSGREGM